MAEAVFALPSLPEMYERWLVPSLFRPWVDDLFARVGLKSGDRLLDVACGTGIVARTARPRVGPRGRVVGVDLSPQMLAVARSTEPGLDWREGNAVALPVAENEKFDVVCCQQGLQFVPDRAAAAREMRRVLAPGGRVAVATWRGLDENPFFGMLKAAAERHLGPVVDRRHSLGDAAELSGLLTGAGFRDVSVDTISRRLEFGEFEMLLRLNAMALVGMSDTAKGLPDGERTTLVETITREGADVIRPFRTGDGVAFDLSTNLATGAV
jgi:ubiquinone/menaquinone biosynthesis C-methylase UbiE